MFGPNCERIGGLLAALEILLLLPHTGKANPPSTDGLSERQKAAHVLNRLGFGPRPGDVERVEKMGIDAYIREQLRPKTIDDVAAEKAVAALDTLTMDSPHLMEEYFADIRRFLERQQSSGDAADLKMRYGIDVPKERTMHKGPHKPAEPNLAELGRRQRAALHRRTSASKDSAGHPFQTATPGSPRRLLEQSLQYRHPQESVPGIESRRRPRRHSAARPGQIPRPARRPAPTARRCSTTSTTPRTPSHGSDRLSSR